MRKLRAVVFDLDDTLYPERDYVLSGFKAVASWAESKLDIPAQDGFRELRCLFEDGTRGDTFNQWLEGRGIDSGNYVTGMIRVYREHEPDISPYPEVPGLLQRLSSHYRLGLVSDGVLAVQKNKLDALGIASYFNAVVFSDELGRDAWKPSTRAFENVLKSLNVDSSDAAYVADNPVKDFAGPKRIGMLTVRFRSIDGIYRHLEANSVEFAPDIEIKGLNDLEKVLK